MKQYSSPVIKLTYYRQTDVICESEPGFIEGASTKDTEVVWGGNW